MYYCWITFTKVTLLPVLGHFHTSSPDMELLAVLSPLKAATEFHLAPRINVATLIQVPHVMLANMSQS
jgi:hypothetical protein